MSDWFMGLDFYLTSEMGPLLVLSIILITGIVGGALARKLHIPGITGQILAGAIIGPAGFDLFMGHELTEDLQPLSTFAMGLITVAVGSQLSYRRIHNAIRRIVSIALGEVIGAVVCVTLVTWMITKNWNLAFVLGAIGAATAPATTVALIRETRSKGPFVKTLLSVVALDNMLCIVLFAFASTLLADYESAEASSRSVFWPLFHTLWQFGGSMLLGIVLGSITEKMVHRPKVHDFSVVFIAILLSVGISEMLDLSPLLTGLFFGMYLGNASEEAMRQTRSLEPLELLLFICFFTMAGASLHLEDLADVGFVCAAYMVARIVGKWVGASIGGVLSRTSRRIWPNLGLGLMPQAGVAIGLVVFLRGNPNVDPEVSNFISTVILSAVTVNEIIGPFFTRMALKRAKETGKDKRRLMEFLQEEYILVDFKANDKWDALHVLSDFYARTHHTGSAQRELLHRTVEERERDFSTAIGHGAAIPHGRIDEGSRVNGVLGICREGIDFDAPDGEPVKLVMLIVTPKGCDQEDLEVMASLARMISDEAIRTRLIAAIDANDAWEIIEGEETPNYNYYLDAPTRETPSLESTL